MRRAGCHGYVRREQAVLGRSSSSGHSRSSLTHHCPPRPTDGSDAGAAFGELAGLLLVTAVLGFIVGKRERAAKKASNSSGSEAPTASLAGAAK